MWFYYAFLKKKSFFFPPNIIKCSHCHLNIESRNNDIVFTKYYIWIEHFVDAYPFLLKFFYLENLCMFLLNTHFLVKIRQAFRIQNVKWTYDIGLFIQQETKKQGQNDCYEKGRCQVVLTKRLCKVFSSSSEFELQE